MSTTTLSLVLAVYAALLSSVLGYMTYRRERRRLNIWFQLELTGGPAALAVHVVGDGPRPVNVAEAWLRVDDGGGYSPTRLDSLRLPRRLEDGDELVLRFPIAEVDERIVGVVVHDTTGREHRELFTRDFLGQIALFRQASASGRLQAGEEG